GRVERCGRGGDPGQVRPRHPGDHRGRDVPGRDDDQQPGRGGRPVRRGRGTVQHYRHHGQRRGDAQARQQRGEQCRPGQQRGGYATVTTNLGQPTEAVDLVTDVDPSATVFSLGRFTAYDTTGTVANANVKATGNLTITQATINSLLIVGNNITVTLPSGGTTL